MRLLQLAQRASERLARVALLLAPAFSVLAAGCADPPGEEYQRGQHIPLGSHSLSVYNVEASSFGREYDLGVGLRIEPLEGRAQVLDRKWLRYFARLRLVDGAGRRHRVSSFLPSALNNMQTRLQAMAQSMPSDQSLQMMQAEIQQMNEKLSAGYIPAEWNRWIVHFSVPIDAGPFSLYLKNPSPREGQPRAALVRVR
jgi:hypothetical protein